MLRHHRRHIEGSADIRDIAPSERFRIERTAYLDSTFHWQLHKWEDIDAVPWRDVHADTNGGWVVPALLQWGDYGGSTVERSNYEVFCEEYASVRARANGRPNWVEVYGSHGSHGVAIAVSFLLSPEGEDMRGMLASLTDYPLADDEHHSELEMRLQWEAWEDYGRHDLLRALQVRAEGLDREDASELADAFDDDSLPWSEVIDAELYSNDGSELATARERNEPFCEDAVSAVWRTDEIADDLSDDYIAELVTMAREMVNAWTVRGAYACLGCRETSAAGSHGTQARLFNAGTYECHYPGCPDAARPGLASAQPSDASESKAS